MLATKVLSTIGIIERRKVDGNHICSGEALHMKGHQSQRARNPAAGEGNLSSTNEMENREN
jgi:hypothetical protein